MTCEYLGVDGSGVLRLCTQCYTGYHWLAPLMRAFQDRHPRVNVQIAVDATYRPIDALLASEIDLAVLTVLADDPRLLVRPLFKDEMLVVVAPSHPLAARAWIEPASLGSEHLIVYQDRAAPQLRLYANPQPSGRRAGANFVCAAHRGHPRNGQGRTGRRRDGALGD